MKRRKPKALRKTKITGFRTTEQERRYIALAARKRGETLTQFIYNAAMNACHRAGVFATKPQSRDRQT